MMLRQVLPAAAVVVVFALPTAAQDGDAATTPDEVRAEISEAMHAVTEYSEQERDKALAKAREGLDQLDAEIERREQALRENWAEMSDAAREISQARLRELRATRNRLGERYGALESGASKAWGELKAGFSDAWSAFNEAWRAADKDPSAK